MVCIYCGGKTAVTNSRHQKRLDRVWRRRRCAQCGAVFSTVERVIYGESFVIRNRMSHIVPFDRDTLFLSVYDACRHRTDATGDAAALTDTVITKILTCRIPNEAIQRALLVRTTTDVLQAFDAAAATHYLAFHPTII